MTKNVNPKSLRNLTHEGRPYLYGEKKKRHSISVTQSGWEQFRKLSQKFGCDSTSDFVEKLARQHLVITRNADGKAAAAAAVESKAQEARDLVRQLSQLLDN
ncbi:MAG: hypothetical protein AAGG51_08935 [Cyanobacteria bacterium P01_G01_bin.54]